MRVGAVLWTLSYWTKSALLGLAILWSFHSYAERTILGVPVTIAPFVAAGSIAFVFGDLGLLLLMWSPE
jgi:hypothetical protein